MAKLRVVKFLDSENTEALLELLCGEITLLAYSYPFERIQPDEHITLFSNFTSNLAICKEWFPPQKLPGLFFAQRICGELIDLKKRIVRVGEIDIVLDTPLYNDARIGSLVTFDTIRLDF